MSYIKFLVPRLVILGVILAISWFSLNMVIQRTLIYTWHSQTGMQLDIGEVKTKLDPTQVELQDVIITTDDETKTKLATVENIRVQFDRGELMRRRFLANETHLSKVKLELTGMGQNGLDMTEYWNDAQTQFDLIAKQVQKIPLDDLMSNNLDEAAKRLARDFQTYDYGDKVRERWSKEIATFKTDAEKAKGRINTIKQSINSSGQTPDKIGVAVAVLQQIDALGLELTTLQNAVPELEKKLQQERTDLINAVQNDRQKLQTLQRQKVEPVDFSEYVLGEEMREKLTGMIAWVDWGRSQIPDEDMTWLEQVQLFPGKRNSGTTVLLPGVESQPEVRFDGIGIDGLAELWGQPLYFVGGIRNYSNQLHKMNKPIVLRFCIAKELPDDMTPDDYLRILAEHDPLNLVLLDQIRIGQPAATTPQNPLAQFGLPQNTTTVDFFRLPETMAIAQENQKFVLDIPTLYVTAVIDRTGEVPHDRFVISCPDYRLPQRMLGNPQQMAFSVSPGVSQFRAELEIKGDLLNGKLSLLQTPVSIQAALPREMQGTPIERGLAQAVRALDTIQAEIDISGTRTAPKYTFYSNVGDRLALQIEPLLQQEWGQINDKLGSVLQQQITTSSNLLDAVVAQEIQPLLNGLTQEHQQLAIGLQQGGLDVDQLMRSQLSRFSEKDQQQINKILASPMAKSLLNRNTSQPNVAPGGIGQTIQQQLGGQVSESLGNQLDNKANELINKHVTPEAQNALRGFLGELGNSRQPQSQPATVPSPPTVPTPGIPLYQ